MNFEYCLNYINYKQILSINQNFRSKVESFIINAVKIAFIITSNHFIQALPPFSLSMYFIGLIINLIIQSIITTTTTTIIIIVVVIVVVMVFVVGVVAIQAIIDLFILVFTEGY